jgi:hypothetical protein
VKPALASIFSTNSPTPPCATIMCKAGVISSRFSETLSPTKSSRVQPISRTLGSKPGPSPLTALAKPHSPRSPRPTCVSATVSACSMALADLCAQAAASQRFMPGVRMHRKGNPRHCQGVVLADWIATGGDGRECMTGTNVFDLSPEARIITATGFANMPTTG